MQPPPKRRKLDDASNDALEWACIPTLSGPRCAKPEPFNEYKHWFKTEADCLQSDCYRTEEQILHSKDVSRLMAQYLDIDSLNLLTIVDPYAAADLADEIAVAKRADGMMSYLGLGREVVRKHVVDVLSSRQLSPSAEIDKSLEKRAAQMALAEYVDLISNDQETMRVFPGDFRDFVLRGDPSLFDLVAELFPHRLALLSWKMVDSQGMNAFKMAPYLDMTQTSWPDRLNRDGVLNVLSAWLTRGNVDRDQMRVVVQRLNDNFDTWKVDRWARSPLSSAFINLGISVLDPDLESTDEQMDIVAQIIDKTKQNVPEFVDDLVDVIERLRPPLSDSQDNLLASLITVIMSGVEDYGEIMAAMNKSNLSRTSPRSTTAALDSLARL